MLFSDLTVLHEHQKMNMRKAFVHKKGRFHPSWPMHSVPERTRVWTHCDARAGGRAAAAALAAAAAPRRGRMRAGWRRAPPTAERPRVAYALRVAVSRRSAVDVVRILCT